VGKLGPSTFAGANPSMESFKTSPEILAATLSCLETSLLPVSLLTVPASRAVSLSIDSSRFVTTVTRAVRLCFFCLWSSLCLPHLGNTCNAAAMSEFSDEIFAILQMPVVGDFTARRFFKTLAHRRSRRKPKKAIMRRGHTFFSPDSNSSQSSPGSPQGGTRNRCGRRGCPVTPCKKTAHRSL